MTSASHSGILAVYDFGKTNAKLFIFGPDLTILYQERCKPVWLEQDGYRVLDTDTLWDWMRAGLRRALQQFAVQGIMVTTHGCTMALLGTDQLAWPILDYECQPPAAVEAAFAPLVPPFEETLSPALPVGFNYGKQIFWLETTQPQAFAAAQFIVPYPQYWCWKFGAPPLSEITSIGCHTHLWSARERQFSSLARNRHWDAKFPPLAAAGQVVGEFNFEGRVLDVHNGVHDSNASLYLGRHVSQAPDTTFISTGTWVIACNPSCDPAVLRWELDMLGNVDTAMGTVPSARFMGGREFDLLTRGDYTRVGPQDIEAMLQQARFAIPSFAPGGPFQGLQGRLVGAEPQTSRERSAIASLYLACMTSAVLDLLQSTGDVLMDGGLVANPAYTGLLAALRPAQTILVNSLLEGTATGAALLAYDALGLHPPVTPGQAVLPWKLAGLEEYFQQWKRLCQDAAAQA